MKTLFLLRHAKSSWDAPDLADFDRPLNDRGQRAARFVGKLIAERGLIPQIIISSPARRARDTATVVQEEAELSPVVFDDRIYEASALSLFHLIREFDDKYSNVLMVGHNPGISELLRLLTGQTHDYPTAALSGVTLDIPDWASIAINCGRLEFILRPKDLMPR